MDKDQLIKRLMATFLGELEEHVRGLNADLLALEREPEGPGCADRYKTLFRAAHSLKGAARSVGAGVIEDACHYLEEILSAARDGVEALDAGRFALLFEAIDAIEEAGMRLREQEDLAGSPLAALLPRLGDAATVREAGASHPAEAPKPLWEPSPAPASPSSSPSPEPPGGVLLPTPSPGQWPVDLPLVPLPAPSPLATEAGASREVPAIRELPPREIPPGKTRSANANPVGSQPVAGNAPRSEPAPESAGGGWVRVPAEKLDDLLTRSGELLVARRRLELRAEEMAGLQEFVGRWRSDWGGAARAIGPLLDHESESNGPARLKLPRRASQALRQVGENLSRVDRELERIAAALAGDGRQIKVAANLLDEEVRRARMLPFAEACQGLERTVRDIARSGGKAVTLVVEGGDVELDRSVLEGLKDPLNHLVRNAVDHGIEPPDRRREAGKAPEGRVTVAAALRGAQVEVVVEDDGAGLDREALRRQARKRGLPDLPEGQDLAHLIFLPGFSTASIITNISGRGVGLDVVKGRLEALHGTIVLASEPGRGTRFTMAVPLTLTTLRALLVSAGGQVFALASTNVQKLVRVDPGDLRSVRGREMLAMGGAPLPVAALADVLGLPAREASRPVGKLPGLVVAAGERRMAFVVDEFLAEQEVVVKGLGPRVRRVRGLSGTTILPSGRIALVLNAASLVRAALGRGAAPAPLRAPAGAAAPSRKRLLVVDDSITTRTLEKSILEAAGYDVATAVDGEAGLKLLEEQGADLLISDVEMPRMDGFELTRAVRGSSRFAGLPVVLFTSRGTDADKARGIEVGADAYIVKGAFDQGDLVETIAQLL